MEPVNLKAYSLDQLIEFFGELGEKPYRARQLYKWLYAKGATEFAQMTDLSAATRKQLAERAFLPQLKKEREDISADGTRKYLFGLPDGKKVETVWIPEEDRCTVCISTQVGCAMGCGFCLTAKGGLTRNLEAWEIVDQLLEVQRLTPPEKPVSNVVMMGMGEPLANLDNVIPALERLVDQNGISLAPRRVTVSTVGLIPQMAELGQSAPYVNLAVSLGAADDAVRETLIPPAKKWPLADLMAACRDYPLPPRRKIFFEYILIKGVNDDRAQAKKLVKLLHKVRCKVNLMAMNPFPGATYQRSEPEVVLAFQKVLMDAGIPTFIRKSRGQDISAACGLLAATDVNGQGARGL